MYTITITKTETVDTLTPREWVRGGTDGASKDGEYGYTPQLPERKSITRTVAELRMDDLEVAEVIRSVLESGSPL